MTKPQMVLEIYNQNAMAWKAQGVQRIGQVARKIADQMKSNGFRYNENTVKGDLAYARHFCPDKLVLPVMAFLAPKAPKRYKAYKPRRTPTYRRVADLLRSGYSRRDAARQLGMPIHVLNSHMFNAIKNGILNREVERIERFS